MKLYFKNLDGLRLIAALLVVYHHCCLFAGNQPTPITLLGSSVAAHWGTLGVNLFFVLSSFLITTLLINENKLTGSIDFKKFYTRRILRIWPLYFTFGIVATCLSALLFKAIGYHESQGVIIKNLMYLATFTINFQIMNDYNRDIIEIFWSVCIEEHFYLIWPVLVWIFRNKIGQLCAAMFIISALSYAYFYFFKTDLRYPNYYFTLCRFDLFAFGAYAALFNHNHKKSIPNYLYIIGLILVIGLIFTHIFDIIYTQFFISSWFMGIVFSVFILSIINKNSNLLEHKIMKEGGKISYGIYVLHPFVAHFCLYITSRYLNSYFGLTVIYPLATIALSWLVASVSYYVLEERFIKMKHKYSVITKD
jgi:peptidoglycan/LPS O-acetylase OafA/YrhL